MSVKANKGKTKVVSSAVKETMTKSEIIRTIAEENELTNKQAAGVLESLLNVIERHIKPRSVGQFVLPGAFKIEVKRKPATKERESVNPFTGEPMTIKAKPARNVVKVKALKKLKEMVDK